MSIIKKGIRKLLRRADRSLLWQIDEQPVFAPVDPVEEVDEIGGVEEVEAVEEEPPSTGILKGWVFSTNGLVTVKVLVNQQVVHQQYCEIGRPDVYSCHKSCPYSLASGFLIDFPMDFLNGIGPDCIEVVAAQGGRNETIWRWEGGGCQDHSGSNLAGLIDYFSEEVLSDLPKYSDLRQEGSSRRANLNIVLESKGSQIYFRNILKEIFRVCQARSSASFNLKRLLVVFEGGGSEQELRQVLSDLSSPRSMKIDFISKSDFPGWHSLFSGERRVNKSDLMLFLRETLDIQFLDLGRLAESFLKQRDFLLLLPQLFGTREGAPGPAGMHMSELSEQPSVFAPSNSSGSIWLTTVSFLEAIEANSLGGLDSRRKKTNKFILPPKDGRLIYHTDLTQPVLSLSALGEGVSATEKEIIASVMAQIKPVKLKTESPVYLVVPAGWNEYQADTGWQYQIVRLAVDLRKTGHSPVFIEAPTEAEIIGGAGSKGPFDRICAGGFAALKFSEIDLYRESLSKGIAMATSWETVRTAYAVGYVTGSPVVWFKQHFGPGFLEEKAHDLCETARLAEKAKCLKISNSSLFIEEGAGEGLFLPRFVNPLVFNTGSVELKKQSILCVVDQPFADPVNQIELLSVLKGICGGQKGATLTLLRYSSNVKVHAGLAELARRTVTVSGGADISYLFQENEIVLFPLNYHGHNLLPLEAMACGAIPIAFSSAGCNEYLVNNENSLIVSQNDFQALSKCVQELFSNEGEKEKLRKAALLLGAESQPVMEASWVEAVQKAHAVYQEDISAEQKEKKGVTVIIPVYCALDAVIMCLRSLLMYVPDHYQIVIINDASDKGTSESLEAFNQQFEKIDLVNLERNVGFIQACYAGLELSDPENDIILLNSDVVVTEGCFSLLQEAAYSGPNVGLACPLSTGSPHLEIEVNPGDTVFDAAKKLQSDVTAHYPTVITAEGQCLYIRRWALERYGFFDPVYEQGFCEESDMCLRMFLHGVNMVVADNALIFHQRSASFSAEGRSELYNRNRPIFDARWGDYYQVIYNEFLRRNPIDRVRNAYHADREKIELPAEDFNLDSLLEDFGETVKSSGKRDSSCCVLDGAEVVFILPSVIVGGGTLSVLQHVNELTLRGVKARVVTLRPPKIDGYPLLVPVITASIDQILNLDWDRQKVIATFWLTAYIVKEINERFPETEGYYYVQDYEPWFYSRPHQYLVVKEAEKTFDLGLKCVSKTHFLQKLLKEKHGVEVEVITPGLSRSIFYPGDQENHLGRPRLSALFRSGTARRGFREILELVRVLKRRIPELEVTFFGDKEGLPGDLTGQVNMLGRLSQNEVANLYRESDIVLDMSYWHGFGRMGIEGMACGAVPALTMSGGIERYAVDGENSVLFAVGDAQAAVEKTIRLVKDREYRLKLRASGLDSASRFSEWKAVDDWMKIWKIKPPELENKVDLIQMFHQN